MGVDPSLPRQRRKSLAGSPTWCNAGSLPMPRTGVWVADITFVPTWSGFAYVAFVTDAFSRKIVGWHVSSRLTTEALPLQALEMASWAATHDLTVT